MDDLLQHVILTTEKKEFYPIVNMVQDDSARTLICEVKDYELPNNASVRLYFRSPNEILTFVDGVVETGSAIFSIPSECLSDCGMYAVQLRIQDSEGKVLKTFNFPVEVDSAAYGVPISDEDKSNIQFILDHMDELVDRAEEEVQKIYDMSVSAQSISSDSSAYVIKTVDQQGNVHLHFGIPRGIDGSISFVIVQHLPEYGEEGIVYLVPASSGEESDFFDEYVFINGSWEKLGSTRIDLSDYATKEELAQKFNDSYFRIDTNHGSGDIRIINASGDGLRLNQNNGYASFIANGHMMLSSGSSFTLNICDNNGTTHEAYIVADKMIVKTPAGDIIGYIPEIYSGVRNLYDRINSGIYGLHTIRNPLSNSGCLGFYFDQWSATGTGIETFRLLDNDGNPIDLIESGIVVGDILSCKADYSASFVAMVNELSVGGDNSKMTVIYSTYPMPNNYDPANHQYHAPEQGYIWFPYKSMAGGENGVPIGQGATAFGVSNSANEMGSFAVGANNTADGRCSFVSGVGNYAGCSAHAEGENTLAKGDSSHTEGKGTVAADNSQHVQGKFNVENSSGIYADIVGGGTSANARENIEATTWTGDKKLKGNVYVECNNDSTGGKKVATENFVTGQGYLTEIPDESVTNDKLNITRMFVHGSRPDSSSISSSGSASFGHTNFISGSGSVIIGNNNDSVDSDTQERIYGLVGNNSIMVGQKNLITGVNSAIIGSQNKITSSHGFTQGKNNTVSGYAASALGEGLTATVQDQNVRGRNNSTTSGYADIVGWGTSSAKKNISALSTSGNLKIKGDVYVGCNNDSTGGSKVINQDNSNSTYISVSANSGQNSLTTHEATGVHAEVSNSSGDIIGNLSVGQNSCLKSKDYGPSSFPESSVLLNGQRSLMSVSDDDGNMSLFKGTVNTAEITASNYTYSATTKFDPSTRKIRSTIEDNMNAETLSTLEQTASDITFNGESLKNRVIVYDLGDYLDTYTQSDVIEAIHAGKLVILYDDHDTERKYYYYTDDFKYGQGGLTFITFTTNYDKPVIETVVLWEDEIESISSQSLVKFEEIQYANTTTYAYVNSYITAGLIPYFYDSNRIFIFQFKQPDRIHFTCTTSSNGFETRILNKTGTPRWTIFNRAIADEPNIDADLSECVASIRAVQCAEPGKGEYEFTHTYTIGQEEDYYEDISDDEATGIKGKIVIPADAQAEQEMQPGDSDTVFINVNSFPLGRFEYHLGTKCTCYFYCTRDRFDSTVSWFACAEGNNPAKIPMYIDETGFDRVPPINGYYLEGIEIEGENYYLPAGTTIEIKTGSGGKF